MALIVECATPVCATSSRGPQPVRSRALQTRRSMSAGVWGGQDRGRLERPNAHAPDASSPSEAAKRLSFHRRAVPGATERAAAAALSVDPSSN